MIVTWPPLHSLDVTLADDLDRWTASRPAMATAWRAVSDALQPLTWEVLGAVSAVGLWFRNHRRVAVFVVLAIFGTVGWYDAVKAAVGRRRPVVPHPLVHPYGASFPSGHAMMSAVAMALVVLAARQCLSRRSALVAASSSAVAVAVAVAFSRLALAAHYLTDVVAGWLLAATWVLALSAALRVRPSRPVSPRGPAATARQVGGRPRAG